jgi:hypothetical protein
MFYYVGQGTQVPCSDGDELDKMDQTYYFEDGIVIDNAMLDHLIKNKNKKSTVILISECCHSGSIWDVTDYSKDPQPRVISIAAAQESQTWKQIVVDKKVLNAGSSEYCNDANRTKNGARPESQEVPAKRCH